MAIDADGLDSKARACSEFTRMNLHCAIAAIEREGALLVFPIDNRKEPASIWSVSFPRSEMRWEWDTDGDNRVAKLWHLRAELSDCRKVVYTKWFRGRATFFSRDVFKALLSLLGSTRIHPRDLSGDARLLLEALKSDSPLSPKVLKALTDFKGKDREAAYNRALRELWSRLLIVGFGEVDDGAFPSLALGASELLFEDLWNEARDLSRANATAILSRSLPPSSLFSRHFAKLAKTLAV